MEPDDIPKTKDFVWILGKKYDAIQDLDRIRRDISSTIWCTYRKNFIPIDENGVTSDRGWGCMLRCGQMVLGVALVRIHLSSDWVWTHETRDPTYLKIIQRFEESEEAPYSLHKVALMGAAEGKNVGQWFGPNTVAQVLKKLVVFDKWSSVTIHVALDNTLIKEDVLNQCIIKNDESESSSTSENSIVEDWMPLLLMIPLRLGLSEINPVYINGLKMCFECPQSIGVIGGKPNQALYLIGCVGDEVIYLDPHTTQKSGPIEDKSTDEQKQMDSTYHCKYASRMSILSMDPSVALCFLCRSRRDFEDLTKTIEDKISKEVPALFEIFEKRPPQFEWERSTRPGDTFETFNLNELPTDRQFDDSDQELEIL